MFFLHDNKKRICLPGETLLRKLIFLPSGESDLPVKCVFYINVRSAFTKETLRQMAGLLVISKQILKDVHENSFSQSEKMIMIKTESGRSRFLKKVWNMKYMYNDRIHTIDYSPVIQK